MMWREKGEHEAKLWSLRQTSAGSSASVKSPELLSGGDFGFVSAAKSQAAARDNALVLCVLNLCGLKKKSLLSGVQLI